MAPNILAIGGAAGQMIPYGYSSVTTTTSTRIAPYAKQGVDMSSSGGSNTSVRLHSSVSSMWVKYHCYTSSGINRIHLYFCNGDPSLTTSRLLGVGLLNSKLTLYSCSESGNDVLIEGTTDVVGVGALEIDVVVSISDTVGEFSLYLNKGATPEVTFSGDTLTNGISTIDRVNFPFSYSIISGVIIADGDTRKLVYKEHSITGEGGITEMIGNYSNINETGINDSNFITANSSDQRDTFTKSAIDTVFTGGGHSMVAQVVWMRAQTDPTSMTRGRLLLYDGSNLSESSDNTLTLGYMPYQKVFSTPPDGGSWDFTKAGNTQPGIKALS